MRTVSSGISAGIDPSGEAAGAIGNTLILISYFDSIVRPTQWQLE